MFRTTVFALVSLLAICHGQNDLTASLMVGVSKLEGIGLPSVGEDALKSCTGDDISVEYPMGELFGATGAFFEDHVMVCGGLSVLNGVMAVTEKCFAQFSPFEDWMSMPGLDLMWPVVRSGFTKFINSLGEEFFWITGGQVSPSVDTPALQSSQVFRYSGSDDYGWTAGVDLPIATWGHCMVQLNDTHVLITGGEQGGRGQNMVFDWDNQILSFVGDFVGGERMLHGCAKMVDGRVMVAAGYRGASDTQEAQNLDTVEIFDPVTETWSEGPKLAEAVDGNLLVGINYGAWSGDILHMGGHVPDSLNGGVMKPFDTIYRYSHKDNQWELLPYRMRTPRAHFNVIPLNFEC